MNTTSRPALPCPDCSGHGTVDESLVPGRCHPCRGTGSVLCDVCGKAHAICASDGTSMCLACLGLAVGEAKTDYEAARAAHSRALRAPTASRVEREAAYRMLRLREAQRDELVALASHVLSVTDGPEPPPRAPSPARPNGRFERGEQLAQDPRIRHVAGSRWLVPSQSGRGTYSVDLAFPYCSCEDHRRHGQRCKHIIAAETVARQQSPVHGAA